jgi:hypothetical protein
MHLVWTVSMLILLSMFNLKTNLSHDTPSHIDSRKEVINVYITGVRHYQFKRIKVA